ncbi:ABC-F family ATP-binding cassette domain-containing protein [Floccifex sp.]|uniref:ABC-F family ATP-binding cassette domain-containing protein n=1 Tax=Floccifex sp. TaxID=2815810 RepID=UPI003F0BF1C4
MLLSVNHLQKKINDKWIVKDACFTIEENEKIALVGINGTGKSTLLKMIADIEPSDNGEFIKKNGLQIYYLSQKPNFTKSNIWDEIKYINKQNNHPKEDFEIKSILTKLGLFDFVQNIQEMSGGQQRKLSIACSLIAQCDLLLLDEPTNHLDNEMIEWLENYLLKLKCSIVMVTHDRYFLNRICSIIFELDQGDFYVHNGKFETYLENKEIRIEIEEKAIQKHKNLYRKELAWVKAGCQARSTKSQARLNAFEELRQQRFKSQDAVLSISNTSKRLGKKTIELNNISFGFNEFLFQDFSYNFLRNDRVGIIGRNGCGKSTLLNIIAGQLKPVQGTISYGETVSIGYFKQNDLNDVLNMRVIDYIEKTSKIIQDGNTKITASQMLEKFLFDKKMQYTTIDRLSGGERKRLYLCNVLMQSPNVLLLDEPTNDLDILTLEVLEDYLDSFNGIVIVVSHDRYFLDRVCDQVFVYENQKIHRYPGGYSDYMACVKNEKSYIPKEKKEWKTKKVSLTYKEKKELENINLRIPKLEKNIEQINNEMNTVTDFEYMSFLCQKRNELEKELEDCTMRWMELEEKNEG